MTTEAEPQTAEDFLGADSAQAVVNSPRQNDDHWMPLFGGVDKKLPAEAKSALDFLGQKTENDTETRQQAINQAYVHSKLPNWTLKQVQDNWPSVRTAFAKEKQLTDGEDINDATLYNKVAKNLDDDFKKRAAQQRFEETYSALAPVSHLMDENALDWFEQAQKPFKEIPQAPNLPDLPALGMNNPALLGAVYNGYVRPFVEGLETPMTVGTLGVGGLLGVAAKGGVPVAKSALSGISGLWTAIFAKHAAEASPQLVKDLKDPHLSLAEKVEKAGPAVTSTTLAILGGLHTISELMPEGKAAAKELEGKNPQQAAELMHEAANQTAEPELAHALRETAQKLDELPLPEKETEMAKEEPKATETPAAEQNSTTPKETVSPADVERAFSIKNKAVDAALKERGEEPATRGERSSWEKASENAKKELRADPEAGQKLIDELADNPRPVTGNEDALLAHEVTRLSLEVEESSKALTEAKKTGDEQAITEAQTRKDNATQDYRNAADVFAQVGTANAHGLAFRAMMLKEDYSLASMERQAASAARSDTVSAELAEQVKGLHEKIAATQKAFDDYRARASELLMNEEKERPQRGKPPSRVLAKLSEQADAARLRIRERLQSGRVSSGLDPLDLADYAIVGADHLAKGVSKFADWSAQMVKEFGDRIKPHLSKIYEEARAKISEGKEEAKVKAFKTRKKNETDLLKQKTLESNFDKPVRRPVQLDEEGLRLQAEAERAKGEFRKALLKHEYENMGKAEKTANTLLRWRRGFLLSSPVTLAKLTGAAALRMGFTPIEEAIGAGLGKIPGLDKIAENAPREGGINLSAEGQALVDAFTKGFKESGKILKTGKSDLEAAFGRKAGEVHHSDVLPPSVIDFFGHVHAALKAPVKQAEFTRSFAKRVAHAEAHDIDVSDPLVQTRLATEAYKDANRAIFMQDNAVVDAYKAGIRALENAKDAEGNKRVITQVVSKALQLALPIIKVPTNIVAETFTYATGAITGPAEIAGRKFFGEGLNKLTPEQNDAILRQLKKGAVGSALLLYGYFNSDQFGGYYQSGEKRKKTDVSVGGARVDDTDIPSYLIHNPAIEQAQIGATVRRIAESKVRKSDKEEQGLASGVWGAALGLTEEIPFAREAVELGKMLDPREGAYARGEFVKGLFVPAVVSWTARQMDKENGETVKRDPKTVMEHVETGIPGLREDVKQKR